MASQQATMPSAFTNRWLVAGAGDEHEHAQRLCRVVGYERDEEGRAVVRVAFEDRSDRLKSEEALLPPHMLLPACRGASQ